MRVSILIVFAAVVVLAGGTYLVLRGMRWVFFHWPWRMIWQGTMIHKIKCWNCKGVGYTPDKRDCDVCHGLGFVWESVEKREEESE